MDVTSVASCDDSDVAAVVRSPTVLPTFDVNRSYTNDGRGLRAQEFALEKMTTELTSSSHLPLAPMTLSAASGAIHSRSIINASQHAAAAKRRAMSSFTTSILWRFRKEMVIGAGADGKVFLAVDPQTSEQIAVKEIIISASGNPTISSRTLQEALEDSKKISVMKRQIDALRRLPPHPNVVQHLGAERTTCALHVMMEFVAGGSISSLLSKLGAFSESVIRLYTRNICSGLAFLHQHGVIHRDIKGANCLIGVDGTAKICDFGCCLINQDCSGDGSVGQQQQGDVKGIHGTSMWMSPECIQNTTHVTYQSDIWSLGCTVVEMATGKPPWHEARFTNEWAAMFHISQSNRGPPIPHHLSRQAHDFLKRCFAIRPEDRPTADECLQDPFLADEGFESNSSNPQYLPPTPTDLNAPFLPANKWGVESHTGDQEVSFMSSEGAEVSNYSSFTGGAVFDQEWGDAETAMDEEEVVTGGTVSGVGTNAVSGLSVTGIDTVPSQNHDAGLEFQQVGKTEAPAPPHTMRDVSLEVIDTFLRHSTHQGFLLHSSSVEADSTLVTASPSPPTHHLVTCHGSRLEQALRSGSRAGNIFMQLDDEYGVGLPESVLFSVLSFLDARSLCRLSCVSRPLRELSDHGAKELLWRTMFQRDFGPVDQIQLAFRKNWKGFYQRSFAHAGTSIGGFKIIRQKGASERVLDAVEIATNEPVVVKVEKWPSFIASAACSSTKKMLGVGPNVSPLTPSQLSTGANSLASTYRAPSPSKDSAGYGNMIQGVASNVVGRLPSISKTPTKNKAGTPSGRLVPPQPPPPPLMPSQLVSPHKERSDPSREPRQPAALPARDEALVNGGSPVRGSYMGPSSSQVGVGFSRPPLGRTHAGTSPLKQRPVVGAPAGPSPPSLLTNGSSAPVAVPPASGHSAANSSVGRNFRIPQQIPPPSRVGRLPSPSQFTTVTPLSTRRSGSPSYRDNVTGPAPPVQFVFLQPSAFLKQHEASAAPDSPEHTTQPQNKTSIARERLLSTGSAAHEPPSISRTSDTPPSTRTSHAPLNSSTAFHEGGPLSTSSSIVATSGNATWHDIYEFQRTGVDLAPLATHKPTLHKSMLQQEYRFLRHLEALGARCVPRLFGYFDSEVSERTTQHNYLVTARLGPSLNELLQFCRNQLSLRTLSLLTIRLLDALEEIHERDVVHGNVSPTNIVMGWNKVSGIPSSNVFLINFAHARFFRDPRTHRPTNTSTTSSTVERARKHNEFLSFCSTFVQKKCTAAPRDDIIALGYVLCYLFHGGLPWTKRSDPHQRLNVTELVREKTAYLETLQRTPPIQLHYFLKSGYALRQGEIPDYRYLKSLVAKMMEEKRWVDDGVFDWTPQLQNGGENEDH